MALKKYAFDKSKEIEKFTSDFSDSVDKSILDKASPRDYGKIDCEMVDAALSKEDYSKKITLKVGRVIANAFTRGLNYGSIVKKQEYSLSPAEKAIELADAVEKNLSRYANKSAKIEFYDPNESSAVVLESTVPVEEAIKPEQAKSESKPKAPEATLEYITFEQMLKLPEIAPHSVLTNEIMPKIRKDSPDCYVEECGGGALVKNVKYLANEAFFELLYQDADKAKKFFKDWKLGVKNTEDSALNSLILSIESEDAVALSIEEITKLPGIKKYWDIRKNILPNYSKQNPDDKIKVGNNPTSGFRYKLTASLVEQLFDDKIISAKIVNALSKKPAKAKSTGKSIDDMVEPTEDLWVTKLEMQSFDGTRKGSLEKVFAEAYGKGEIERRERISDRSSNGGSVQFEYKFTKKLTELAFNEEEKGKELYERFVRGEKIIKTPQKKDITELLNFIAEGKMLSCDEINMYEGLLRISTIEKKLRAAISENKIEEDRTLSDAKKGPTKFKLDYDFLNGLVDDLNVYKKIQDYFIKNEAPVINLDDITDEQLSSAEQKSIIGKMRYDNVFLLTLNEGQKLVFKPTDKQEPHEVIRNHVKTGEVIPPLHQTLNEIATSLVDEALGFNLVPKTVFREINKEGGALRAYVVDFKIAEDIDFDKEDLGLNFDKESNLRKALKFIVNDCEGHLKNWGIDTKTKKVVVIDQALTFFEESNCSLSDIKADKELLEKLESADVSSIAAKLESLNIGGVSLAEEQINAFLDRIDILKRHLKNQ